MPLIRHIERRTTEYTEYTEGIGGIREADSPPCYGLFSMRASFSVCSVSSVVVHSQPEWPE